MKLSRGRIGRAVILETPRARWRLAFGQYRPGGHRYASGSFVYAWGPFLLSCIKHPVGVGR